MTDLRPSRRQLLAGLSALALAPALVACDDDDGGGGASAVDSPEPTEQGAFPVTIAHKFGETTPPATPSRSPRRRPGSSAWA